MKTLIANATSSESTEVDESMPVYFALGIMAWNEEASIGTTIHSLFKQSVFHELARRNESCELFCIANGCTDHTVARVTELFRKLKLTHPEARAIRTRVVDIPEPGRNNAWNRFVHEFSSSEARFIFLMDADIVFQGCETLQNLLAALERDPWACISTGQQHKSIEFKKRKTLRERLSLATSRMTETIEGRFSGQLYCMRSGSARSLYLPRDLSANDDGFFKAVICSCSFSIEPDPRRIVTAPNAGHIYEPYLSASEVFNNQKRQMIGQTWVYVLIEHLKTLRYDERTNLVEFLKRREEADPDWLRKLLDKHLARVGAFWRIFPGILTFRFRRLWKLKGARKITHLPATLVGFTVTLIACARASRFLRTGRSHYWPKVDRKPVFNLPKA